MISRRPAFAFFCIAVSLLFQACAGSLFGSNAPKQAKDLEQLGTRAATPAEEKRLDRCLFFIFKRQQSYYARNRRYIEEVRELKAGENCEDIRLALSPRENGFEASAIIEDGETAVKWSVDESGEAKEHNDLDMEFEL